MRSDSLDNLLRHRCQKRIEFTNTIVLSDEWNRLRTSKVRRACHMAIMSTQMRGLMICIVEGEWII